MKFLVMKKNLILILTYTDKRVIIIWKKYLDKDILYNSYLKVEILH